MAGKSSIEWTEQTWNPVTGCDRVSRVEAYEGGYLDLTDIDWLIVGGESGPRHRPMDRQWVRDLRDAARPADTALFVKQMGGFRPGNKLEDLPEDLRIREMPRARVAIG